MICLDAPFGVTTLPEQRDDAQLTLLTPVSLFGDSIASLILSKNQKYEKPHRAEAHLHEDLDCGIRNTQKTTIYMI
jgi:hypothetical protein